MPFPVEEATGLTYAGKARAKDREVPMGHRCGHDMHVAHRSGDAVCRGARGLAENTNGRVPSRRRDGGGLIDDGLFRRFPRPAVVLGQHVMVGPAGAVAGRTGAITSAADSLQIRLFGRSARGSMPQAGIDPVVTAAATVMRRQTVVSREVAAAEAAVVTSGAV